jgi:hypothetical protein
MALFIEVRRGATADDAEPLISIRDQQMARGVLRFLALVADEEQHNERVARGGARKEAVNA